MTYFNLNRQLVLWTEASFNEGITAAQFQKGLQELQPVHFISRSLMETKKCYSKTEKDTLAVILGKR